MSLDSYQPYVEDYDSQVSEVIPLTRRQPVRGKSGLSNEMSSSYDGVSDSGYSSTNATPNETPPLKSTTPAPINTPSPRTQKDAFKRASTPGIPRPSSKAYNRTASPAVPRNIPGAKPRERSPTMPSTGGADECDCADCNKNKGSPPSPSMYGSYHGSYSQSPSWSGGFQYPPSRYDGYDSGVTESPREEKKRSSMPPPVRPSSTFSGTSSSYSAGYGGYFAHAPSPAPAPPTPSSTCPPTAFSAYPPPPLNTANHSPGPSAFSPYGPPPSIPPYGGQYDPYPVTPSSSYPDTYSMPPPPLLSGSGNTKRRNSTRGAYHDLDDYTATPPQRRSSRTGDRPPSWAPGSYRDLDGFDRSMSVPPGSSLPAEAIRRKTTTPGPAPRRRESGHSQGTSGTMRLGPSALCRAMESCAIDDAPVRSSHSRSHSDYYSHGHGSIARRDPGTVMHEAAEYSASPSRSTAYNTDELVQMTMPDMDGETLTMRYPAGIPVKIALGHKSKNSMENNVAYRCVQQRQQQVHAQLQYAALEHGGRKSAAGDYTHRSSRRATMSGA